MRTLFFSALALPAFFLGAIAAPAVPETAVVEKRQLASAYSIVDALYADIQTYTGAISESTLLTRIVTILTTAR